MASGPLAGLKIVEFAGIGPGPFCGMLLADMGADVVRLDRVGAAGSSDIIMGRGKRSVAIDLKHPRGAEAALALLEKADACFEGFRPGVMERLGLGPDVVLKRNPRIVYGRMTGWGQTGPLADTAGHDINYISLTGALNTMGKPGETPSPPLNLVGDYGGGALYLAFGLLAGLLEAKRSGKGQVVDAAMVDGAASLMTMFYGMRAAGLWTDTRHDNLLDGAAHFYDVYECADGKFISTGAIEPQFYAELLKGLGLKDADMPKRLDRTQWAGHKDRIAAAFKTKTREAWEQIFEGTDACVSPVLSMAEAPKHPHNVARGTFQRVFNVVQPAPAPRFSRTPGAIHGEPQKPGANTQEVLKDWGISPEQGAEFLADGAMAKA